MRREVFQKDYGVYSCRLCERQTRGSGGEAAGVELCRWCYEESGIQNAYFDGTITFTYYQAEVRRIEADRTMNQKGGIYQPALDEVNEM